MGQSYDVITISEGYEICEAVTLVDSFTAFNNILSGSRQFKYTCAEIIPDNNEVKLTQHFIVCPHCGQHIPAYSHFISDFRANKVFTRKDAKLWSEKVKSLSENEKLELYKPVTAEELFICNYCGSMSDNSDKKSYVSFIKGAHKLTVVYPFRSLSEIIKLNWSKKLFDIDRFPIAESVTFNFKRGTTYLTLKTASGKLLAARDITAGVNDYNLNSPIISLLSKNVFVKRKLKNIFKELWGKRLPFSESELNIYKFALSTAYIGYDDINFYSCIPYDSETMIVDRSYRKMCKKMHLRDNLADVYKNSCLPDMKSVKKRFFSNQGLFFYLPELETLWKCTKEEPNFFCSLLDSSHIFMILAFLHDFPAAFELYELIADCGFYVPFRENLIRFPKEVCEYALFYACSNDFKKQQAKHKIIRSFGKCLMGEEGASEYFYNIPDRTVLNSISAQNIEGYVFSPLKVRKDYVTAGEQLNNCLGDEEFYDTPIIGVSKSGKYFAAIQIDVESKMILQAYLKNNCCINMDKNFLAVFNKWCKKNGYKYFEDQLFED